MGEDLTMTYLGRDHYTDDEWIDYNRRLCEKYPFLVPYRWRRPDDFDYSYTEMDGMPDGWRKAFGDLMLEDVSDVLRKANFLDKYAIAQIKEKFGSLRWYDDGVPKWIDDELHDVIDKYEHISAWTCIKCGRFPAGYRSSGWIAPYCDKCGNELVGMTFHPLDDKFDSHLNVSSYYKGERVLDCSGIVERMRPIQDRLFADKAIK